MLKILLKRQLYELNRSFFYDPKKGKSRSKFASAAFIVLYALLMVCVLGGMFAFCAYQLANPLRAAGLDWLYFALFGIIVQHLCRALQSKRQRPFALPSRARRKHSAFSAAGRLSYGADVLGGCGRSGSDSLPLH